MDLPVNAAVLTLAMALLLNLAGLIWGAAKIDSAVKSLSASVTKLDKQVGRLDERFSGHDSRLRVLEDRQRRRES